MEDPQYIGCYWNFGAMSVFRGIPGSVTACIEACGERDYDTTGRQYTYAGLQYGGHCYCGDSYATKGASLSCYNNQMVRCSAEPNNGCGGPSTISVYKVCPPGSRGDTCQFQCSNCKGSTRECRKWDGVCLGCPPGWSGTECEIACVAGKYGYNCTKTCPSGCRNNNCDQKLGYCLDGCDSGNGPFCSTCPPTTQNPSGRCPFCDHCLGGECVGNGTDCYYKCPSNWQGDKCKACPTGRWGPRCYSLCAKGCEKCEQATGDCVQCKPGYYGGADCYPCGRCEGGDCDRTTGECAACQDGYHGIRCDKTCPTNCKNNVCDQTSGKCEACQDGLYGSHCNMTCGKCSEGICEQDSGHCDACISGYYGDGCTRDCPPNCDRSCEKMSGNCDSCKDGHHGGKCESSCGACQSETCNQTDGACSLCKPGFYGTGCQASCSEFCVSEACDQKSGNCDGGGCKTGFYGSRCDNKCPMFCGDKVCEQMDGACIGGCQLGYYGVYCESPCGQCADDDCNSLGSCLYGCKDGWQGLRCDSAFTGPSNDVPAVDDSSSHVQLTIGLAVLAVFLLATVLVSGFLLYHFIKQRTLIKKISEHLLNQPSAEHTNNDTVTTHTNAVAMETVSKEYEAIDTRDIDLTPTIYDEVNTCQYENVG